MSCAGIAISIYKSADSRIVIPAQQIIEPRLLVVHITAIPQRIQLRKGTGRCQDLAPGIVAITRRRDAVGCFEAYYIALQVGDVIIDLPPRSADFSNRQNSNIRTLPLVQCCRFTLLTSQGRTAGYPSLCSIRGFSRFCLPEHDWGSVPRAC